MNYGDDLCEFATGLIAMEYIDRAVHESEGCLQ